MKTTPPRPSNLLPNYGTLRAGVQGQAVLLEPRVSAKDRAAHQAYLARAEAKVSARGDIGGGSALAIFCQNLQAYLPASPGSVARAAAIGAAFGTSLWLASLGVCGDADRCTDNHLAVAGMLHVAAVFSLGLSASALSVALWRRVSNVQTVQDTRSIV